jgi:hypothetical protein
MLMTREQNAGHGNNIKTANKYLVQTFGKDTNKSKLHALTIKSKLNSGNACHDFAHNL